MFLQQSEGSNVPLLFVSLAVWEGSWVGALSMNRGYIDHDPTFCCMVFFDMDSFSL
jgi:hypothetical protein